MYRELHIFAPYFEGKNRLLHATSRKNDSSCNTWYSISIFVGWKFILNDQRSILVLKFLSEIIFDTLNISQFSSKTIDSRWFKGYICTITKFYKSYSPCQLISSVYWNTDIFEILPQKWLVYHWNLKIWLWDFLWTYKIQFFILNFCS